MVEAIVEFEYTAVEADELSLRKGDKIADVKIQPGGWWEGTLAGKRGMFPDNFVKVISKTDNTMKSSTHNNVTLRSSTGRRCRVLFSYQPANEDELRLNVDDVIDVITEVEDGWWKGRLGEMVGVFPSNFVTEILSEEPRRPRPGSRDEARRGLESESDNDRSTSVSSPETAQVLEATAAPGAAGDADVPSLPPKPVKEQCRVLFAYDAANGDELTLNEGEIVTVLSRDVQDKGWWRGELAGKVGLFPDNFVELIQAPAPAQEEPPTKPVRAAVIAKPVSAVTNKLRDSITRPPTKTEVPPVPGKKPPICVPGRPKPSAGPDAPDGAGPSRLGRSMDSTTRPISFKTTESTTSSSRSLDSSAKPVEPKPSESAPQSTTNSEHTPDTNAFDHVARSAMLTHPTALRVKPPARRPPSNTSLVKEEDLTPSLTNGTSTENLHTEESKKSWEKEKNKPPWMEELKRNQTKKQDVRTSRPVSLYTPQKSGSSPPTTKALTSRTTTEVAGNGVSSVMSKSLSFKSDSTTRTAITAKVKKEDVTDVTELTALVRALQASLDQYKEETSRELHDLAQKLNEERQKRAQVEQQLNKLTDLVTQV